MIYTDLEKRFQGLHFEVGKLPGKLVNSAYYWSLPYEVRRFLFFISSPSSFRDVHRLHSIRPEGLNAPTLKPFHETKSIYVHIPKTAGISVVYSLYGRKVGDHRTVADYKLCFRRREFESFFKFAFVRNPWDRLLSAYLYLKSGGRNKEDQDWARQYLSPFKDFDEFVKGWVTKENVQLGLHFRPQYQFLGVNGEKIEVDFIGYYENIIDDFEFVKRKIGAVNKLSTLNKTSNETTDYRSHYNDHTREIVQEVYKKDVEIFYYDFDNFALKNKLANR